MDTDIVKCLIVANVSDLVIKFDKNDNLIATAPDGSKFRIVVEAL